MTNGTGLVRRIVLASGNLKKLAELQALFADLAVELVAQSDLGIEETDEPHTTFVENGLRKARHAAQCSGLPALADDSGLCVDALGGAPGVASAVYAGAVPESADEAREARRARQDAANNAALQRSLDGAGNAVGRRAHFLCTLVALRHADDPAPLVAQGRWHGTVRRTPAGEGGFGYDPWLQIDALGCSVAELSSAEKNRASHRALAAASLRDQLVDAWGIGLRAQGGHPRPA